MNATTGTAGRAATPAGNGGETAPPALRRQTMPAIVQDTYGAAGVWRVEEIARPEIAGNEVLVKVHAAGLDRGTWHLMAGQPYLMRLMGYGLRTPKSRVPGLDVAGTVVAVGAEVTRFAAGDEVFGISHGSFAEYACAREDKLARKPANLTFGQAAAVAVSGLTALQGLRDDGRLRPGQDVLIIGASGGVGTFAVQIAGPEWAASCGRWPSRCSCASGSPCSPPGSATPTSSVWPSSSEPASSHRSSTGPTRCTRRPAPCVTSKRDTPRESSSSR
jgi:Alcohol dehydrogenase GroES-like domain